MMRLVTSSVVTVTYSILMPRSLAALLGDGRGLVGGRRQVAQRDRLGRDDRREIR